MRIDCDHCAIRATHEMVEAYFASYEQDKVSRQEEEVFA